MNERGKFRYALLLAGTLFTAVPCFAAETVEMRINRLEQELAELKALVQTRPAAPATVDTAAPIKKAEPSTSLPVSVGSGVKVQLYGFVRFDTS